MKSADAGNSFQSWGSIRTQKDLDGCVQVGRASWVILTFPCAQDVGVRVMGGGLKPQLRKWQLHPVAQTRNLGIFPNASLFLTHQQIPLCPCWKHPESHRVTSLPLLPSRLQLHLPSLDHCPPCCCPCQSGPPGRCSSPRASPLLSPSEEAWSLQGSQELLPSSL